MSIAYIALGTNMGDRTENINTAIESLKHLPLTKVLDVSNIYETEPWGYLDQQNFLNLAVKVETELSPHALLGACLGIEAGMGRVRKIKNGPRVVDLDLLFYDSEIINTKELVLPHPGVYERGFVLQPLSDILKDKKVLEALENTDKSKVQRYEA